MDDEKSTRPEEPPLKNPVYTSQRCLKQDHGYAWVVCGASSIIQILQCAIIFSMGMFYIIFRKNMEGGSSDISLISSINMGTHYMSGPIAGVLVSKFGWRGVGIFGALFSTVGLILASQATCLFHLYISYGIITGFGFALQYNPCLSVLPVYFNKWLGLASGIVASGCGIGSFIFPPILKYLESEFGWRGALLLCAGTQLQVVIFAALFRPAPLPASGCNMNSHSHSDAWHDIIEEEENTKPKCLDEEENCFSNHLPESNIQRPGKGIRLFQHMSSKLKSSLSIFKSQTYTFFCFSQLLFMTANTIIYTHYGAFALSLGFTDEHAALLFLVIGISSTIMRLLSGVLIHLPGLTPLCLCFVSISSLGILTCLMQFYTTLPLLLMYSIMFGILCGPYNTLIINVIRDVVTPDKISAAVGFLLLFLGPGSLFGAPIAGLLYDTTKMYVSSFYLAGTLMIVAGVLNVYSMCLDSKLQATSESMKHCHQK